MKKIIFCTLSLFLTSINSQAQIIASENFETTEEYDIPQGWFSSSDDSWGFYNTYVIDYYGGCSDNQALVTNLWFLSDPLYFTSPNYTGLNAGEKIVSYQLRIFDYETEVPVDYNFGVISLFYSLNNGTSWTSLGQISNTNYTPSMNCQEVTYTIPASVITASSSLKFKWESNYSGTGDYDISIDNFVLREGTTASNNDLDKTKLKIFPNPVSDFINIEYDKPIRKLTIFDVLGRNIGEFTDNTNSINTSFLSSGTYLLRIETENNETESFKFIKK